MDIIKANNKNILFIINTVLLIGIVLIWIIELYKTINYDSVLFNSERIMDGDNRFAPFVGIVILSVLSIFLFIIWRHDKIITAEILSLIILSLLNLIIHIDKILFYLPVYHNESFILMEYFIIYYSIISLMISIANGVLIIKN